MTKPVSSPFPADVFKRGDLHHICRINMADVDENKRFLAMLNGITRHDYYKEEKITDAFLKEEIYPDISENDFSKLLSKARGMLKVCTLSSAVMLMILTVFG